MEQQKDKWINDILNSTDGIQRVEPNPFLFAKIRARLARQSSPVYVPARMVWFIVTSFALLVLLNWRILSQSSAPTSADATPLSTVVSDMQLYPTTNQSYELWSGQNY